MTSSLYIELEPDAIKLVQSLMPVFGTSDIASTVAQALGVAKVAVPFIRKGFLTVVDPDPKKTEPDNLVDIDVRYEPPSEPAAFAA